MMYNKLFHYNYQSYLIIFFSHMLRTKLLIIALLLQLLKLKTYFRQYAKKSKLWNLLSTLNPLSPTALKQYLMKNPQQSQYAICKGILTAGEQTSSILQPAIKTLYSQIFLKKKMQVKQALHEITQYIRKKTPSYLKIKDAISQINIYETIKTKFFTTHNLTLTNFQFFKLNSWKKINFMKHIFYFFRDNRLPQITDEFIEEKYLPDGINGIIFGKFKLKGNEVVCTHPSIVGINQQRIARKVKHQLKFLTLKKVLVIALLVGTLATLSIDLYNLYKQFYQKKQNDTLAKYKKISVTSRICSTCKKQICSIINEPCGHLNQCAACYQQKKDRFCLQCNRKKKNMVEIYVC